MGPSTKGGGGVQERNDTVKDPLTGLGALTQIATAPVKSYVGKDGDAEHSEFSVNNCSHLGIHHSLHRYRNQPNEAPKMRAYTL